MPAISQSAMQGFQFSCLVCRGPLEISHSTARCTVCQKKYACQEGIWRFLPPDRANDYQDFLRQYRNIRKDQGWGRPTPEYYRLLPLVEPADPQRAIWSMRFQHYRTLVQKVLEPLENLRGEPLKILDLGAGNGWLSNRLSQRGHSVAAVDINPDSSDGLGAYANYENSFLPIQAEFDRLPFAPTQADLVVFTGAFHYSCNYQVTLEEAFRTLKSDGQLVILDSPFYHLASSGEKMVSTRQMEFFREYGFASDSLPSKNYLTWQQMKDLGQSLSFSWQPVWPIPASKRAWRWIRSRSKKQPEPAQFPIILVKPYPIWRISFPRRVFKRLWTPVLRWSYRLVFEPHSRHARLELIDGRQIRVFPGVFDPSLFRTGEYLVSQLNESMIPPGCRVLDMGTGTGIGAIFAACWARSVVAIDINPEAVRCARENFVLNRLDDRIEVRQGNLFSPLKEERFDVVLFNPPFLYGTPTEPFERSFYSTDIADRFADGLPDHLNPGGYALLLLSSLGETSAFLQALRWRGFQIRIQAERDWVTERVTLYQVIPGPDLHIAQNPSGLK